MLLTALERLQGVTGQWGEVAPLGPDATAHVDLGLYATDECARRVTALRDVESTVGAAAATVATPPRPVTRCASAPERAVGKPSTTCSVSRRWPRSSTPTCTSYPLRGGGADFGANLLDYIDVVRGIDPGTPVSLGEAWLYKASDFEVDLGASNVEIYGRDPWRHWRSRDRRMLELVDRLGRHEGFEFVAPLWIAYFFAQLEYGGPAVAGLDAGARIGLAHQRAFLALTNGDPLTSLGTRWSELATAPGPAFVNGGRRRRSPGSPSACARPRCSGGWFASFRATPASRRRRGACGKALPTRAGDQHERSVKDMARCSIVVFLASHAPSAHADGNGRLGISASYFGRADYAVAAQYGIGSGSLTVSGIRAGATVTDAFFYLHNYSSSAAAVTWLVTGNGTYSYTLSGAGTYPGLRGGALLVIYDDPALAPEAQTGFLVENGAPGYSESYQSNGQTITGSDPATQHVEFDRYDVSFLLPAHSTSASANLCEGADAVNLQLAVSRVRSTTDPYAYCTAKINSLGCVPDVSWSGTPSATSSVLFVVSATQVINHKPGVFCWGTSGPSSTPFQGGIKCVAAPTRRSGVLDSGGNFGPDDCSGAYGLDFNTIIRSGADPALAAGAHIHGQFWTRDPDSPSTTGRSNAIGATIRPSSGARRDYGFETAALGAGRSELYMSRDTFQLPSGWRRRISRYLPVSRIGAAPGGVSVIE